MTKRVLLIIGGGTEFVTPLSAKAVITLGSAWPAGAF